MDDPFAPLDALPVDPPARGAISGTGGRDPAEPIDVLPVEAPRLDAVSETERIASLDVLRGLAVLGILVMNIQSFAMIDAAYANPTAYGDLEGANYVVWLLSHLLADQKFMTIFSMLFGAGIVLMAGRREEAGLGSAAVHYRRMGALALFGLLHAYLFWHGDILFFYALCGLIVYVLRNLRPWLQLVIGFLSVAAPSVLFLLLGLLLGWALSEPEVLDDETRERIEQSLQEAWQPDPEEVDAELAAYRGGWLREFQKRWRSALAVETIMFPIWILWRAGGLMLIGMALFKLGFFSAKRSPWSYLMLVVAALFLGVPIILYGVSRNFAEDWDPAYGGFLGSQFNYWASIIVSLGWVGLVMLVYQQSWLRRFTRPLAAVGQMALTNYLLHTLICTTIFYGHGFGLFGHVERVGQIGIVFAIWAFQLIVSPLWLRFFRFGPAEWVWRSVTYLKFPALLRRDNPA